MGVFRRDNDAVPARPASYSAFRPLTAAANRIKLQDKTEADLYKNRKSSTSAQWQSEAWEYYDAIGEIKYAFNLVASVVSRIRLYAAVVDDPAEAPVAITNSTTVDAQLADAAERALARLDSAYGGQAGLLRDAALNLSVAGECYLVQVPERVGSGIPESWDIRSVDELQVSSTGQFMIAPRRELAGSSSSGQTKPGMIPLPPTAFVGRMWRAHPRFSDEPDSSLKGLLDLCAELLLLNRTFRATARSRLNAGAMYIPDGLSTTQPENDFGDDEGGVQEEYEDEFEEQLMDAMTTPIEDESSAAAVVPLIIRGPSELGDKIKQFKFERSFDAQLIARADRVLERILQGLDVPKDTVTGLANVKYSNAIQIDESLYKSHIEPMLLLISDAITVVFLRPYLRSIGFDETAVERIVVWYDPSSVATRNDRASDADSGFEKMAISFDTWRRAHGFSDSDAPNPTELALRIMLEKGSMTPETSEAILQAVAPDIMNAARGAQQAQSVAPVPESVDNILNGGTGGTTPPDTGTPSDPAAVSPDNGGAPTDPSASSAPPATPPAPQPAAQSGGQSSSDQATPDVPPGQDAPPFPLAEPRQ